MSWGTKIAAIYSGFVLMIGVLVFRSSAEKVDLVSADYYAQELKFQDKIDGENNMNSLSGKVECKAKNRKVSIQFPAALISKNVSGEILFYRPSDSSLDITCKVNMDSVGKQIISDKNFKRGLYKMQLNCSVDNKLYYFEQAVFMN